MCMLGVYSELCVQDVCVLWGILWDVSLCVCVLGMCILCCVNVCAVCTVSCAFRMCVYSGVYSWVCLCAGCELTLGCMFAGLVCTCVVMRLHTCAHTNTVGTHKCTKHELAHKCIYRHISHGSGALPMVPSCSGHWPAYAGWMQAGRELLTLHTHYPACPVYILHLDSSCATEHSHVLFTACPLMCHIHTHGVVLKKVASGHCYPGLSVTCADRTVGPLSGSIFQCSRGGVCTFQGTHASLCGVCTFPCLCMVCPCVMCISMVLVNMSLCLCVWYVHVPV